MNYYLLPVQYIFGMDIHNGIDNLSGVSPYAVLTHVAIILKFLLKVLDIDI